MVASEVVFFATWISVIVQLLTHLSCKIDASSHCLGVFAAEVCIILESASSGSLREACHCQDCMLVTWVVRWIWCRCRGMEPGQFQQTFFCAVLCNEFSPRYKITQKQCQTTLCTHYGRPCIHSSIEFSVDMSIHPWFLSRSTSAPTQEHMPMSTCLEFSRSRWKWSQSLGFHDFGPWSMVAYKPRGAGVR
jgi:hypothetical protein